MNLRTLLIAGVSALFGLCLAVVVINSVSAQQTGKIRDKVGGGVVAGREPVTAERFKLFAQSTAPAIFMYDTTTADCWLLVYAEEWQMAKWVSLGNPRNAAAEK